MDKLLYEEMVKNLDALIGEKGLQGKKIFLFGHCHATEELSDLLVCKGFKAEAILDNHAGKQGKRYHGIEIRPPQDILTERQEQTIVCIAARAYASMALQLKRLGYRGNVRKLVEYNSYAEYSLSRDTVARKRERVKRGMAGLERLAREHKGCFKILCPFAALGDVYLMMSYLPHFLAKRKIGRSVIGVTGQSCAEVVRLFGPYEVEVFRQEEMDEMIQAALYTEDPAVFIPHQDRPYVVNLSRALYVKRIPLEQVYCCGVFGLPGDTRPFRPGNGKEWKGMEIIRPGNAVILSPYAKSVTALPQKVWEQITEACTGKGLQCFTNVAGSEKPLPHTIPISPPISGMRAAAERAGTFIGLRSGLCDVIREAACRKIALYPDYHYCDTRWKAIEMYRIEGWENIIVKEGFQWKTD